MWLLSYDVSADGRRAKVAARLERRGFRILYSSFVISGGRREAGAAYNEAQGIAADTDRLLLLRTCERCELTRIGAAPEAGGASW